MEEEKLCIRVYTNKERLQLCSDRLETAAGMIQTLSQVFSLAGSETRLKLLYLLEQEESLCVCDLSDMLQMTMPAVSQHLRKLKDANIIQSKKVGQTVFYSLKQEHQEVIKPLLELISREIEIKTN